MTLPTAQSQSEYRHRAAGAVFVVLLAAGVVVMAGVGGPHDAFTGALMVIDRLLFSLWPALAWVLGALGLGLCLGAKLLPDSSAALRAVLGVAVMLWVSHLSGVIGLPGGGIGAAVAWLPVVAGLVLGGARVLARLREGGVVLRVPWAALPAAVALAVLTVAASNPPGWLWDSEFRAYDTLSYHLLLPQQWIERGRVWPGEDNVYGALPGYLEAAWAQLGAMTMAPREHGLIAGEGYRLLSCQMLHALLAVVGAWVAGEAARHAASRAGLAEDRARVARVAAGLIVLCTPWALVTGSLAYNDMAMVALGAGALLAAVELARVHPLRRGLATGLLVGAACSVKPTAALFFAPVVGVLLLVTSPRTAWVVLTAGAIAGGMVMVAPWLARNALATGNPVFPFAAGLFPNAAGGTGWWSAEQVARFAGGHRFEGGWLDRLRLLVMRDASDPMGPAHRGALHAQWSAFFPAVLLATLGGLAGITRGAGRGVRAALLLAVPLQVAVWATATHLQSRFLLPVLAPGAIVFALWACAGPSRRRGPVLAGVLGAALAAHGAWIFSTQSGGHPNRLLAPGPAARTGFGLSDADRRRLAPDVGPEQYVNFVLPPGTRVYLLGDAAGLYFTTHTMCNSTWDRWLIAEVMNASPSDPGAWGPALKSRGCDLVLVNMSEVSRLKRSGWIDPAVDPDVVARWMTSHTTLVRGWPEIGVFLVDPAGREERP
ncbi:MAG: hypothetical protein DYG92_00800 [Leptolyngbya sp. PLA1]|nr:hypothetical protein [Leptolyngbya sp. PLA1]